MHTHVQKRAPAPGFSGTMSLSQSPTFPTAVVRRRLLRHGWPARLKCLSTRLHRDLLNLHTHTHTQRCCVFSSARWLDTNRMEMWRDSLHDDYVDSVRGHQDDGLPPETCTQTQTQIFINTIFVTMTVSYLANWYPNHSWIVIVSLQSYHMTFSS